MTRLFNSPADFPQELLEGFAAAYPRYVHPVRGGVIRSTRHSEVAVLAGGGSGHYPAFCGLVGPGLAHGAVMGNLFSSPSTRQALEVARAAEAGRGVVFTFGNYAGDVMHFGEAARLLREEGMEADCVLVTDDIASAPAASAEKRRGIAGDLIVFKIMGAAAAQGRDHAAVVAAGRRANSRTFSLGVAFSGCTLPGAEAPLFTVPEGMMSIGLGIHGEPGIADVPVPTADELAELFVERLLAERPAGSGPRVAVLLNGLGTVKYEELFVVYRRAAALLAEAGLEIVDPEVGELCTSLDMAGASLTLFWLDEDLEALWSAPAATPAFHRGSVDAAERIAAPAPAPADIEAGTPAPPASDEDSRRAARRAGAALAALTECVIANAEELGRIDAVAGDGDHGIGMERGSRAGRRAAESALEAGAGARSTLEAAGAAWADRAGGTSGMLWGGALAALGRRLGDEGSPATADVAEAVAAAIAEIQRLGGARAGDKTMIDAMLPFSATLDAAAAGGATLAEAWSLAAASAVEAAAATAQLRPMLGRARPLAERSLGTPDAGATSFGMIATAIAHVLAAE